MIINLQDRDVFNCIGMAVRRPCSFCRIVIHIIVFCNLKYK
ncbi:hypothetical protein Mgra_00001201, partial [Meloidogyne graminicola]